MATDPNDKTDAATSGPFLTTSSGTRISDNQNSLRMGVRGPTLLEDFILREKITHFDHERIPERVVHARGSAAHGYFQVYESMADVTRAKFLQDPSVKTPVFVRFSTVVGSRGSADLARDVRGFAVKFYTEEGNFDLVGNNIPVFFIQDAIKFPDLVHAVKPEPHHEMPQAASAHDTFWDFISLMPESMHMIMWVMSDRAIPRSYRMMEGFGVHTFRFVNEAGKSTFVKFHWKPVLGMEAVAWEEAQKINGKDPDFHRRDLYEAIETGAFPEYELGVQLVAEEDEHKFGFDLLDATKIIPEELVPVRKIGKLVLHKNPDNFFNETEQAAFHPGHIVPGIDFTNDPLLQGRLFSYLDTQLLRLGGPNFNQIPINQPKVPVHNNQRDGFHRHSQDAGRVSYEPNSLASGCPMAAAWRNGGFVSFPERASDDAQKLRIRSETFSDHYSQAALFFRSMTPVEQDHIVEALQFELAKVETAAVRERVLGHLRNVDDTLATRVAAKLGVAVPTGGAKPTIRDYGVKTSPALSMELQPKTARGRKIAILVGDGVDHKAVGTVRTALEKAGVTVKLVGPKLPSVKADDGSELTVDHAMHTVSGVLFDAVFVPGGTSAKILATEAQVKLFILEMYKYAKAIVADGDGRDVLAAAAAASPAAVSLVKPSHGVHVGAGDHAALAGELVAALAKGRAWDRPGRADIVA